MPKAIQPKAKADLHQIWLAETREMANKAFDHFLLEYGVKYDATCTLLAKDRDVLLAFYNFPAEHWSHLRTTNTIESTFATIRLRHRRTRQWLEGPPKAAPRVVSGVVEKVTLDKKFATPSQASTRARSSVG